MVNITPKKERNKQKSPEIQRFQMILTELGIKPIDISNKTGIAERTINNSIWQDMPIWPRLLRELHSQYNVSLDWLLSGEGDMFLHQAAGEPLAAYSVTPVENPRTRRMMRFIEQFMCEASPDEQVWLEMQLKIHVPQYLRFLEQQHE